MANVAKSVKIAAEAYKERKIKTKTLGQIALAAREDFTKNASMSQYLELFDSMWEHVAKAVIAEYEARKWQPIESAPWNEYFLAEDSGGSWIKVKRYKNPFGETNTVINRRSGKWFTATRWQPMPVPQKQESEAMKGGA